MDHDTHIAPEPARIDLTGKRLDALQWHLDHARRTSKPVVNLVTEEFAALLAIAKGEVKRPRKRRARKGD